MGITRRYLLITLIIALMILPHARGYSGIPDWKKITHIDDFSFPEQIDRKDCTNIEIVSGKLYVSVNFRKHEITTFSNLESPFRNFGSDALFNDTTVIYLCPCSGVPQWEANLKEYIQDLRRITKVWGYNDVALVMYETTNLTYNLAYIREKKYLSGDFQVFQIYRNIENFSLLGFNKAFVIAANGSAVALKINPKNQTVAVLYHIDGIKRYSLFSPNPYMAYLLYEDYDGNLIGVSVYDDECKVKNYTKYGFLNFDKFDSVVVQDGVEYKMIEGGFTAYDKKRGLLNITLGSVTISNILVGSEFDILNLDRVAVSSMVLIPDYSHHKFHVFERKSKKLWSINVPELEVSSKWKLREGYLAIYNPRLEKFRIVSLVTKKTLLTLGYVQSHTKTTQSTDEHKEMELKRDTPTKSTDKQFTYKINIQRPTFSDFVIPVYIFLVFISWVIIIAVLRDY